MYLYAIERCGANGLWQDELFLGHHTPNGVANIMSEAREVNVRKSRLEWCPGMARQFHTSTGTTMPLVMGSNGLGFLRIRPITDHKRIVRLLKLSPLTPSWLLQQINAQNPTVLVSSLPSLDTSVLPSGPSSDTAARLRISVSGSGSMPHVDDVDVDEQPVTYMPTSALLGPSSHALECLRLPVPVSIAAQTLARQLAGASTLQDTFVIAAIGSSGIDFGNTVMVTAASMALSGVGVAGKLPTIAPYDVLMRVHCILGHASLDVCLATIAFATTLPKGFITKAAIQEFVASKCGICESAKMRRRTFRMDISGVTDTTIPEIGKSFVFDTLGLRVPCAQWAFINITRFTDRNPKGIRRSYGHVSMDAAAFEALILTMRAYVRPHTGEIHVMKKDGHPSHRSHLIKDLFVDSSMNNHESPPYVHEGVNTENSFQWSVPSAMATLAGSGDGEEHFYTAFLYCEHAENRSITLNSDGKSREQRFTGRSHDLLATSLVFGSPCKFLQHPEVRDSKFDLHALPGRYRGPSRDDESDHRCWVQSGKGATMRHITVDKGCMRIDERSVLVRCDRNHASHQPMAIDGAPAAPAPDFSRWLHPGRDSYELLDLWTSSTPLPAVPTIVLIGAGSRREGDGPATTKALTGGAVHVVAIDHELGGYEHDWRLPAVQQRLIEVVTSPSVITVVYMLNCNPWSALHCIQPGPPVLFDANNLSGIRDASGQPLPGVVEALAGVDPMLAVLRAAFNAGKQLIGETPVGRGAGSLFAFKEPIYASHVNAFTYPPLASLHAHMGSAPVYSDQSQVGAATQKTTEWMVTAALLPAARQILGTLRDASYRRNTAETSLIGAATGNYSKSAAAARYTPEQWNRLIRVALSTTPHVLTQQPIVVPAAREASPPVLPASVQRPRREATEARYTVSGELQTTSATRASLDKARRLRGQVTLVGGDLIAMHIIQQQPPEVNECLLEDMAVMVLQAQHQRASLLRGMDTGSLRDLDGIIETVDVRCTQVCIQTGDVVNDRFVMALADGVSVPVHLDTAFSRDWHKPVTYRDFLRSPQKALWRTAMELRMDMYKAIPLFILVAIEDVLSQGFTIVNTLWAFSIKYDEAGTFDKLNPRWCMMGGGMDRTKHESYAEVCRWTSVLIIIHIRCAYETVSFSFDISNAFQNTFRHKAVEPGHPPPTRMFCYQAPGFAEHGPNGEKLCCELLMLMQGAIDASRLFGTAFGHTLLKRAGARRALWDREVWEYHVGPLSATAETLENILAACSSMPPTTGAPPGWAVFSKHTDDGLGTANAQPTVDYLMNAIGLDWAVKASGWTKHLGYGLGLSSCGCFCSIDCIPVIEALYQRHLGAHNTFKPKHPYPMNISELKPGVRPPIDSPERAPFDEMQAKCQNGLATSIWISRAHTQHVYSTNFLCGMMSNPSYEVYKCWQHSLMHLRASPCPLILGSGRKVSLSISTNPPRPFSGVRHREMGLHIFVDADLGTPKARAADASIVVPPIASGRDPMVATADAKSVSGIRMYLGGVEFVNSSLRQHLTSPDPHTSEVGAAGTAITMALPLDGLLRELHIFSDSPMTIYCDSQSTIFASRSAAAVKRSVWIERRSVVLREFVELRACVYEKIEGRYNTADGSTKPIPHATWLAHRSYSHPYADLSDAARAVVASAFHVSPTASGAQAQFDTAYAALIESDRSSVDRLFMLMEGG